MKSTLLAAAFAATIIAGCGNAQSDAVAPSGGGLNGSHTGVGQMSWFTFFRGPAEAYQHQMAPGPDGNVWFRDTRAGKIGFITPTGSVTEYSLPLGHAIASGIATGADGNIWYSEDVGDSIGRVTTKGIVTIFSLPDDRDPMDITPGGDGNLWFTAMKPPSGPWWIGKMTTAGKATFYRVPGLNANLNDITLGADGNVWYANGGSKTIGRITPSGTITEFNALNGITPKGVARATDGALYSAIQGPSGTLLRTTTSGSMSIIIDPRNSNSFDVVVEGPQHCVWGNRVCAGNGAECLDLYNVNRHGFVEYQFPSSVTSLAGLVAGPDGNIWFQVYSKVKIQYGLGKVNTY